MFFDRVDMTQEHIIINVTYPDLSDINIELCAFNHVDLKLEKILHM